MKNGSSQKKGKRKKIISKEERIVILEAGMEFLTRVLTCDAEGKARENC